MYIHSWNKMAVCGGNVRVLAKKSNTGIEFTVANWRSLVPEEHYQTNQDNGVMSRMYAYSVTSVSEKGMWSMRDLKAEAELREPSKMHMFVSAYLAEFLGRRPSGASEWLVPSIEAAGIRRSSS